MGFWDVMNNHPFVSLIEIVIICSCLAAIVENITKAIKEAREDRKNKGD